MPHTITNDPTYAKLSELIKSLDFDAAEKYLQENVPSGKTMLHLHNLAEDRTGILTYTFANYMLQKHENSYWHNIAATLLLDSLDHLLEDNKAAFYHLKRGILLDPENWHLKEAILNLYKKGVLEKSDAVKYAREVLKHDKENVLALEVIS